MPGKKIIYTDSEGNKQIYIGDPRHFKKPKKKNEPKEKLKRGGRATHGYGKAYMKGGKV